ncbi:unnamed protein product, partial [Brassica rapa subsp. trilocularis]
CLTLVKRQNHHQYALIVGTFYINIFYLFAGYLLWPQKISFRGVSFSRYCGYRDI